MIGVTKVVLTKEAAQDVRHGKDFYAKKFIGLGDYFAQSLLADLESLKVYGGVHIKVYGGVHIKVTGDLHRVRSKRFPYVAYYRVKDDIA